MAANKRAVENWDDAAADAYSFLNEKKREFSKSKMWQLIDVLATAQSITQDELLAYGPKDFIATTLGHVTTAVHGPGAVPKQGGWYRTTINPHTYHLHQGFADAWKMKRRLT